LAIIALFAGAYYMLPGLAVWPGVQAGQPRPRELWFAPVYYSAITLTTLGNGDVRPANTYGEMLSTAEVIIGYVWLGYLVSIFAHRTSARA
jgi:Ion channel